MWKRPKRQLTFCKCQAAGRRTFLQFLCKWCPPEEQDTWLTAYTQQICRGKTGKNGEIGKTGGSLRKWDPARRIRRINVKLVTCKS